MLTAVDTDKEVTEHLKENLKRLKSLPNKVEVMTVAQVLAFEDEIERTTDVKRAQDFTKSKSVSDFKSIVSRMNEGPFRAALKRRKFDMNKLWAQKLPKAFDFVKQDGGKVKSTGKYLISSPER